jgi:RNA polymerase sigma-70 factor (ECF subfamily)
MTANGRATPQTQPAAFEREALPHMETLSRVARRMTRHEQLAEDLVQDTLEGAYRHFGRYQPGTNIRAWLLKIMTNLHVSNCRRLAAAPSFTSVDMTGDFLPVHHAPPTDHGPSDVEACTVDRLAEEAILATIDTLPPSLRAVVRLACVEGLAGQSIADTLGIPLGTVASRLHRARYRLRHALRDLTILEDMGMEAA